jgi:hypothetical protein
MEYKNLWAAFRKMTKRMRKMKRRRRKGEEEEEEEEEEQEAYSRTLYLLFLGSSFKYLKIIAR